MAVFYAFFSYSHNDAKLHPELFDAFSDGLEELLNEQITNSKVCTWRDIRKLRLGEKWDDKIKEALRASDMFILMLSPKWIDSDYCRSEYRFFEEVEKSLPSQDFVLPLVVLGLEDEEEFFGEDQKQVYASLRNRQQIPVGLTDFLKMSEDERTLLVFETAKKIKERINVLRRTRRDVAAAPPPSRAPRLESVIAAARPPAGAMGHLGGLLGGAFQSVFSTRSAPKPLPPHNLPLQSIGAMFMGRDAMMDMIASELAETPVLALYGMGGVGKTRLAIEYAWRNARDYAAALFLSAETPEILNAGLAGLATTLNLSEKDLPQDPPKIEAVLDWLARTPGWLLILDNVDDEKAAAPVVALLPKLANGRTLITARYDKFPASVPKRPVGVLDPDPARDFLLARTKDGRRAGADDSARAAALSKELDQLALALEQAGAFISAQKISFERYVAYWRDERARVLGWFDQTAMGINHDVGLAAVWATSVARLSVNGRRLFDRLAFLAPEPIPEFLLDVAVPPFSHEVGEGANGRHAEAAPQEEDAEFDARAALGELYAYSLAAPAEVEGRYAQEAFSVHRLVQDFALRSMSDAHRSEMLRETLAWVNAAFDGDPDDVRTWPKLDPLAVHAVCVAKSADKAGIADSTARLMNQIGLMLKTQARNDDAEPLYRRALAIDETSFGPDHPNVAIRLNNLASLLQDTNRLAEAEPLFHRAVKIFAASLGPDHPNTKAIAENYRILLAERGASEEEAEAEVAAAMR